MAADTFIIPLLWWASASSQDHTFNLKLSRLAALQKISSHYTDSNLKIRADIIRRLYKEK